MIVFFFGVFACLAVVGAITVLRLPRDVALCRHCYRQLGLRGRHRKHGCSGYSLYEPGIVQLRCHCICRRS